MKIELLKVRLCQFGWRLRVNSREATPELTENRGYPMMALAANEGGSNG